MGDAGRRKANGVVWNAAEVEPVEGGGDNSFDMPLKTLERTLVSGGEAGVEAEEDVGSLPEV